MVVPLEFWSVGEVVEEEEGAGVAVEEGVEVGEAVEAEVGWEEVVEEGVEVVEEAVEEVEEPEVGEEEVGEVVPVAVEETVTTFITLQERKMQRWIGKFCKVLFYVSVHTKNSTQK
jgi:hypothetical protein